MGCPNIAVRLNSDTNLAVHTYEFWLYEKGRLRIIYKKQQEANFGFPCYCLLRKLAGFYGRPKRNPKSVNDPGLEPGYCLEQIRSFLNGTRRKDTNFFNTSFQGVKNLAPLPPQSK